MHFEVKYKFLSGRILDLFLDNYPKEKIDSHNVLWVIWLGIVLHCNSLVVLTLKVTNSSILRERSMMVSVTLVFSLRILTIGILIRFRVSFQGNGIGLC